LEVKTINKNALTDEEIISEVKNGDSELFGLIVKRYNQRLYRIAISYGIPDDDCDEVLQVAYISAYEKIHQFRGEARFSTWLTRILINECLQLKRKKQRIMNFSEDELVTNSLSNHLTPESDYMEKEIKEILEDSIQKLPDKYRIVYILKEVEGMSIAETSSVLAITEENVKVRLHRAKSMLKNIIKDTTDVAALFTFGSERCDRVRDSVMNYISRKEAVKIN